MDARQVQQGDTHPHQTPSHSVALSGGKADRFAELRRLLPVTERRVGEHRQAVDGRALHAFLDPKTRFDDWMRRRISDGGLVEGRDYEKFNDMASSNLRSANRLQYALALDVGKRIGMGEHTPNGDLVRDYFLECERAAYLAASTFNPLDPRVLAAVMSALAIQVAQLESDNAEKTRQLGVAKRKLDFFDRFMTVDATLKLIDLGRGLRVPPLLLIAELERARVLFRDRSSKTLMARADFVERGLFANVPDTYRHPKTGETMPTFQARVLRDGYEWVGQRIIDGTFVVKRKRAASRKKGARS